ncbi:MAG: response regulator [Anaerolineae bacterium CFX3]|nr:response regulator [Anaerolineae bacterium CFX3]
MKPASPESGVHPMRVLIVDDHPNTATMLARAVAQLGKQVEARSATSGREALKVADDFAADLLITDMIMPEMNGLELAEKLQNHPGGRPAHVILITAYDVPGLKETARRAKVDEILLKPVRPERICQIVENLLGEWNRSRPAAAQQAAGRPHRILVADDRPDNVTLLSRYLENEGYEYIAAADGVEALEQARRSHPDLVLLDVNMPKKDGFAVLEEMRADADLRHIPVIILTAARIDPSDVQAGFHLGADDYVTKPFDRRELMARIRTKLRVKESSDHARSHRHFDRARPHRNASRQRPQPGRPETGRRGGLLPGFSKQFAARLPRLRGTPGPRAVQGFSGKGQPLERRVY